jgi:hypothetical protein
MQTIKIGGWARIALSISAFFLVIGLYQWKQDSDYATAKATETYQQKKVAGADPCAGMPPTDGLYKLIGCPVAFDPPRVYEEKISAERDMQIDAGQKAAISSAFNIWFWPTLVVFSLFAALGWIRRGFKK